MGKRRAALLLENERHGPYPSAFGLSVSRGPTFVARRAFGILRSNLELIKEKEEGHDRLVTSAADSDCITF